MDKAVYRDQNHLHKFVRTCIFLALRAPGRCSTPHRSLVGPVSLDGMSVVLKKHDIIYASKKNRHEYAVIHHMIHLIHTASHTDLNHHFLRLVKVA